MLYFDLRLYSSFITSRPGMMPTIPVTAAEQLSDLDLHLVNTTDEQLLNI